jgi:hypothetical protein
MKKIITSVFVFTFLALFMRVGVASAQAVFNSPGEMPTITITNDTRSPCSYGRNFSCWKQTETASPGDVIAVHLYYKNTSSVPAEQTTLSVRPQSSGATTFVTFTGGVASLSGPRTPQGPDTTATLTINGGAQSLTFMQARWYPVNSSATRSVEPSDLFGTGGFAIGTVTPGTQGVLVVNYKVSNTIVPPPPTVYACSDDRDNDGDGLRDYPNDPGCTSSTDNDEYNAPPVQDECRINYFTASPTMVVSGGVTTLSWSTTGCTSLAVDGVPYPINGSGNFGPLYGGRSYQLRATGPTGLMQYQSVYVGVQQIVQPPQETQCFINYFTASPTMVVSGGTTTLSWSTTGCDYLTIDGVTYPVNGSGNFGPLYGGRSYELRASRGGYTQNRSVYVGVQQIVQPPTPTQTQPQAVTTVATLVGQNSAQLNGLAILNSTGTGTTWFEWGTTPSLGNRTTSQNVYQSTSVQVSDGVINLLPNTRYYYRIGVTNQYGTVYGSTVAFVTAQRSTTVVVTPSPQPVRTVVVARSAPSLLELRIESVYANMCVNGDLEYRVYYRNISSQTLENTVLRVTLPKELTYIQANRGKFEIIDRTLTIDLGEVRAGEQGEVTLRARVNREAVVGNLAVATATVVYTNTISRGQEDAIAYSLITVSDDCPNLLGASAFGIWSFLPDTLIEWLLLILIILALVVLVRQMTKKKEE